MYMASVVTFQKPRLSKRDSIRRYKSVQTGPNIQFGGLKLVSFVWIQPGIDLILNKEPRIPIIWHMSMHMTNYRHPLITNINGLLILPRDLQIEGINLFKILIKLIGLI